MECPTEAVAYHLLRLSGCKLLGSSSLHISSTGIVSVWCCALHFTWMLGTWINFSCLHNRHFAHHAIFPHSSGSWEVQNQCIKWFSFGWVPTQWLILVIFSPCPHLIEDYRKFPKSLFRRTSLGMIKRIVLFSHLRIRTEYLNYGGCVYQIPGNTLEVLFS